MKTLNSFHDKILLTRKFLWHVLSLSSRGCTEGKISLHMDRKKRGWGLRKRGETSLRCLVTVEMESFFPRLMFARHLTISAIIRNQSQGRWRGCCHHREGVAVEEMVTLSFPLQRHIFPPWHMPITFALSCSVHSCRTFRFLPNAGQETLGSICIRLYINLVLVSVIAFVSKSAWKHLLSLTLTSLPTLFA